VSWLNLAKYVFQYSAWPKEKIEEIQTGFGEIWGRFAHDLLDANNKKEYNALKHGLRPKPGGFRLAIGRQEDPNIPCPSERMQSLGGSDNGSSFFLKEPIGHAKHHFRPRTLWGNWSVANTVNALGFVAMSIENVVSFLRIENGDNPSKCKFTAPEKREAFGTPWAESIGPRWVNMDSIVRVEDIEEWSKKEIEQRLEEKGEPS